ncbi:ssDNA-binding protein, partial [Proteus mirabilis]
MEKFITHHIQILAYVINFIAYDFKKFTFAGVPHMASRGVN